MSTRSALEKARTAEQDHGPARTTVLRVVEQRLRALGLRGPWRSSADLGRG